MILAAWWVGCADLDGFVFAPVHCSTVGPDTCAGADDPWDAICARCAEPYDWQRAYDWMPGTLAPGEDVRPVDPALVERVTFPSADGLATLDGYFLASHRDDPDAANVTIVYDHGNYAGIEHYQPRVRLLHEAGYNVFVWDYRGYGKSLPDATPTGEQLLADADTAWDTALGLAPEPTQVVPYGYSLGAIAATRMAERGFPCGLVLEAPFTSLAAIARDNTTLSLGEQMLSAGDFDNGARMERIGAPVLAMAGALDDLFPPDEVRAMVQRGPGPREVVVVPGARHGVSDGGIPEQGLDAYLTLVGDFLVEAGCRSSSP